jgi:hypothetical protein
MEIIKIVELAGMLFGILGATIMMFATRTKTAPLLNAYYAYGLSNYLLLFVAAQAGLVFIYMQTIIFGLLGLKGIYTFGSVKRMIPFSVLLVVTTIGSAFTFQTSEISVNYYELFFTVFAITGTFFMANKDHNVREYAYLLFLLADVGFIVIALHNQLEFFASQTAYYLFTAAVALYRNDGYIISFMKGVKHG